MNSLRYSDFKLIYSIYPPPEEQKAISKLLDCETARIDSVISMLSLVTPSKNEIYVKNLLAAVSCLVDSIKLIDSLQAVAKSQIREYMAVKKQCDLEKKMDLVGCNADLRNLFIEMREALIHHAVLGNVDIK